MMANPNIKSGDDPICKACGQKWKDHDFDQKNKCSRRIEEEKMLGW